MSKFDAKVVRKLHNELLELPSYKENELKIYPGEDGNTLLVVKRDSRKISEGNYVLHINVIEEFDSYEEFSAFMSGIMFMYYEGVHF